MIYVVYRISEEKDAGLGMVYSYICRLHRLAAMDSAAVGRSNLNGRRLQCRVSARIKIRYDSEIPGTREAVICGLCDS